MFGRGDAARHARAYGSGHVMLDTVRRGEEFEIVDVADENMRVHALRFGMAEGSRVSCVTKIPAGPVVLRSGRQEIAVGRSLARCITVRYCDECCEAVACDLVDAVRAS